MNRVTILLVLLAVWCPSIHADLKLKPGTQIVFPDGSTLGSANLAGEPIPPGHGGTNNSVLGEDAFIGGGNNNRTDSNWGTVGGGRDNTANGTATTVSGGFHNTASSGWNTIGGGSMNSTQGNYATVGGGYSNFANQDATVAGGSQNRAESTRSTVGGGKFNHAGGSVSTIAGGAQNSASGGYSAISGGLWNFALEQYAAVGGGLQNSASEHSSVVGGGYKNTADGIAATVPGGQGCQTYGDFSFAAGRGARILAEHDGTFLWSDDQGAIGKRFDSVEANEFAARATGGVRFVTAINSTTLAPTAGATLGAGASSWATISARETKENFRTIDAGEVLDAVARLPIERWNYRHQNDAVQHIGPMAQDFHAAFGLNGEYDGTITTQDLDGVALAAIQGLNAKIEAVAAEKDAVIAELRARIDELERSVMSK